MKITALTILKFNGDTADPTLLANASDVSNFGYFQRSSVREMIIFVSRTVGKRTPLQRRQSVEHEEYMVHCYNKNGLLGLAFVDRAYPLRGAFSVINKILEEYERQAVGSWSSITTDNKDSVPWLQEALVKYQDPSEADKLTKIQRDLDETKIILHKTIDSVLARGEKLDSLVEKSTDLSMASQVFYKQAKKANSCCVIL
ncbi:vesicle transport protein [Klebsormidium nitens]|uniref:Vesicle transport protein n=1 Tax=Klebsormidium nitens TaxID=105231 RepID=A0A1Y1IFK1_KLENI|nr:vesicle transport protein [Klebsormidium nitens]|eukprot:GAQ87536.1 vesicle transport protein [Klebsormidium nitens]